MTLFNVAAEVPDDQRLVSIKAKLSEPMLSALISNQSDQ
jgi:hypothetical protein